MAINIKDFAEIEKRIAYDKEHSNQFESIINKYTGPGIGTKWNDETGKLEIATGWHADENGDVVRD